MLKHCFHLCLSGQCFLASRGQQRTRETVGALRGQLQRRLPHHHQQLFAPPRCGDLRRVEVLGKLQDAWESAKRWCTKRTQCQWGNHKCRLKAWENFLVKDSLPEEWSNILSWGSQVVLLDKGFLCPCHLVGQDDNGVDASTTKELLHCMCDKAPDELQWVSPTSSPCTLFHQSQNLIKRLPVTTVMA